MISLARIFLFESMYSGQETRYVKFKELPPDARRKFVDVWKEFFKSMADAYRSAIERDSEDIAAGIKRADGKPATEDDVESARETYKKFADMREEHFKDISSKGESYFENGEEEWFTDGDIAAKLWWDDRFAMFDPQGEPEKRKIKNPDHIYYWDGNEWYGDDERMFPQKKLTSSMRQIAIALASTQDYDPGINPELKNIPKGELDKAKAARKKSGSGEIN